ncbi:unnamed protein product [Closterium sp. Yama58-4]|nr:unnamed protein product [Closterium sp. Yama58-4]
MQGFVPVTQGVHGPPRRDWNKYAATSFFQTSVRYSFEGGSYGRPYGAASNAYGPDKPSSDGAPPGFDGSGPGYGLRSRQRPRGEDDPARKPYVPGAPLMVEDSFNDETFGGSSRDARRMEEEKRRREEFEQFRRAQHQKQGGGQQTPGPHAPSSLTSSTTTAAATTTAGPAGSAARAPLSQAELQRRRHDEDSLWDSPALSADQEEGSSAYQGGTTAEEDDSEPLASPRATEDSDLDLDSRNAAGLPAAAAAAGGGAAAAAAGAAAAGGALAAVLAPSVAALMGLAPSAPPGFPGAAALGVNAPAPAAGAAAGAPGVGSSVGDGGAEGEKLVAWLGGIMAGAGAGVGAGTGAGVGDSDGAGAGGSGVVVRPLGGLTPPAIPPASASLSLEDVERELQQSATFEAPQELQQSARADQLSGEAAADSAGSVVGVRALRGQRSGVDEAKEVEKEAGQRLSVNDLFAGSGLLSAGVESAAGRGGERGGDARGGWPALSGSVALASDLEADAGVGSFGVDSAAAVSDHGKVDAVDDSPVGVLVKAPMSPSPAHPPIPEGSTSPSWSLPPESSLFGPSPDKQTRAAAAEAAAEGDATSAAVAPDLQLDPSSSAADATSALSKLLAGSGSSSTASSGAGMGMGTGPGFQQRGIWGGMGFGALLAGGAAGTSAFSTGQTSQPGLDWSSVFEAPQKSTATSAFSTGQTSQPGLDWSSGPLGSGAAWGAAGSRKGFAEGKAGREWGSTGGSASKSGGKENGLDTSLSSSGAAAAEAAGGAGAALLWGEGGEVGGTPEALLEMMRGEKKGQRQAGNGSGGVMDEGSREGLSGFVGNGVGGGGREGKGRSGDSSSGDGVSLLTQLFTNPKSYESLLVPGLLAAGEGTGEGGDGSDNGALVGGGASAASMHLLSLLTGGAQVGAGGGQAGGGGVGDVVVVKGAAAAAADEAADDFVAGTGGSVALGVQEEKGSATGSGGGCSNGHVHGRVGVHSDGDADGGVEIAFEKKDAKSPVAASAKGTAAGVDKQMTPDTNKKKEVGAGDKQAVAGACDPSNAGSKSGEKGDMESGKKVSGEQCSCDKFSALAAKDGGDTKPPGAESAAAGATAEGVEGLEEGEIGGRNSVDALQARKETAKQESRPQQVQRPGIVKRLFGFFQSSPAPSTPPPAADSAAAAAAAAAAEEERKQVGKQTLVGDSQEERDQKGGEGCAVEREGARNEEQGKGAGVEDMLRSSGSEGLGVKKTVNTDTGGVQSGAEAIQMGGEEGNAGEKGDLGEQKEGGGKGSVQDTGGQGKQLDNSPSSAYAFSPPHHALSTAPYAPVPSSAALPSLASENR